MLGGTPKNNNPEDALSSAKYHLALAIDRAIEKARDVETFGVNMDNAINTLKQIKACL